MININTKNAHTASDKKSLQTPILRTTLLRKSAATLLALLMIGCWSCAPITQQEYDARKQAKVEAKAQKQAAEKAPHIKKDTVDVDEADVRVQVKKKLAEAKTYAAKAGSDVKPKPSRTKPTPLTPTQSALSEAAAKPAKAAVYPFPKTASPKHPSIEPTTSANRFTPPPPSAADTSTSAPPRPNPAKWRVTSLNIQVINLSGQQFRLFSEAKKVFKRDVIHERLELTLNQSQDFDYAPKQPETPSHPNTVETTIDGKFIISPSTIENPDNDHQSYIMTLNLNSQETSSDNFLGAIKLRTRNSKDQSLKASIQELLNKSVMKLAEELEKNVTHYANQ